MIKRTIVDKQILSNETDRVLKRSHTLALIEPCGS